MRLALSIKKSSYEMHPKLNIHVLILIRYLSALATRISKALVNIESSNLLKFLEADVLNTVCVISFKFFSSKH